MTETTTEAIEHEDPSGSDPVSTDPVTADRVRRPAAAPEAAPDAVPEVASGATSGVDPVPPAVVCDLSDAPDTGEERLAEYARLFDAAFVSRERTQERMVWRLRADPGIQDWARDLAARENACCAFMTNTITVADGQVVWEATTIEDPAARAVLDLFYDLPVQRWAGVEQVHERWVAVTGVPIVVSDGLVARPATVQEITSGRSGTSRPDTDTDLPDTARAGGGGAESAASGQG